IKTRVGRRSPEEWPRLLEIYNRYPLSELIVHPRIQSDLYRGQPRWETFSYAVEHSKNPLTYNGNLFSVADTARFSAQYSGIPAVMLGRGAVADPQIFNECRGGEKLTRAQLQAFHDRLYAAYQETLSGEKNPIFRMRELWSYWAPLFENPEKPLKKIRRAECRADYEQAVNTIFRQPFLT
ncbi:MAG: diguanylate cyclase, partial [Clostridiales bacterium]|nr:diguanylate cyclase [Clostridiales bacterium]